jgi:isopenicillin-N N-acyltransferase-like protein
MLRITASGTPSELGLAHGRAAARQIRNSLSFYRSYFAQKASLDWDDACVAAMRFLPYLEATVPHLVDEMRAVAAGASDGASGGAEEGEGEKGEEGGRVRFEDILAMNCRTEISMGLMNDGCTSFSFHSPRGGSSASESGNAGGADDEASGGTAILAQNWDWDPRQIPSLICLTLRPSSGPVREITQITEAGIVGKIGFNSARVGVCLNAIRARGVDYGKLPIHLALRVALECVSAASALEVLEKRGVASAGHILISDGGEAVSTEWSCKGLRVLRAGEGHWAEAEYAKLNGKGGVNGEVNGVANGVNGQSDARDARDAANGKEVKFLAHTNHWLVPPHPGTEIPKVWLSDSEDRVVRATSLLQASKSQISKTGAGFGIKQAQRILADEEGYPFGINRAVDGAAKEGDGLATLFSIVMDLKRGVAEVKIGRPTEGGEALVLKV